MASPMPGMSAIIALTATLSHGCPVPLSIYLLSTAPFCTPYLLLNSMQCTCAQLLWNMQYQINAACYAPRIIHMVMIVPNFKM